MLVLLLALACSDPQPAEQVSVTNGVSSATVTDYGNGVYYIRARGQMEFGNALSAFIKNHPILRVMAVTGNGSGVHGTNTGYFIVTRPASDCN
jgi:hypothetical protein